MCSTRWRAERTSRLVWDTTSEAGDCVSCLWDERRPCRRTLAGQRPTVHRRLGRHVELCGRACADSRDITAGSSGADRRGPAAREGRGDYECWRAGRRGRGRFPKAEGMSGVTLVCYKSDGRVGHSRLHAVRPLLPSCHSFSPFPSLKTRPKTWLEASAHARILVSTDCLHISYSVRGGREGDAVKRPVWPVRLGGALLLAANISTMPACLASLVSRDPLVSVYVPKASLSPRRREQRRARDRVW